jgi:hypothetical protein
VGTKLEGNYTALLSFLLILSGISIDVIRGKLDWLKLQTKLFNFVMEHCSPWLLDEERLVRDDVLSPEHLSKVCQVR